MFDHRRYVPVMKWRQGEYQALMKLDDNIKQYIIPLLEIPAEEWDFENECPKKTVDEHIAKFGKRLKAKWGSRLCFVDSCYLAPTAFCASGQHHFVELIDQAEAEGCSTIPVSGLDRVLPYQTAVSHVVAKYKRGLCLRLKNNDFDKADVKAEISAFLLMHGVQAEDVDLVIDLGEHVPHSANAYAVAIQSYLLLTPYLNRWRSLTVSGTSFPFATNSPEFKPLGRIERFEWLGYKALIRRLGDEDRLPAFSDYTVAHPRTGKLDPRLMDPNAKIKYTTEGGWIVVIGNQIKRNGREQYRELCKRIINAPLPGYDGAGFSDGDLYIQKCADGLVSTGGSSTWPTVMNNHHLTRVVSEIATLYGI